MKLDASTLVPPLAAIVIFVLVLTQTREALQLSGAWQKASAAAAAAPSPFADLENELRAAPASRSTVDRDPLRSPSAPVAVVAGTRRAVKAPPQPPPAAPILTSIIFDADPRATVRWDGHDYSVRPGGLFADFRVTSIARDEVVLDHGGESLVLRLPKRGEH